MEHSHMLRSLSKTERTVRPTVPKREHYKETCSYFRGNQLMIASSGEAQHQIPSLCDLHDFDKEPSGVINV